MAGMTGMAACGAWTGVLLALALWSTGCSAIECPPSGRFWDGCNWCFCRGEEVAGCTNMACIGPAQGPGQGRPFGVDADSPTIGPPAREGILAYRPGRGRVVDPAGWPCQIGSSWLEAGGCVRCICSNKRIKCRDSGLCLNGELLSNDLLDVLERGNYVRRRRDADAAVTEPVATPTPAAAVEARAEEAATTATAVVVGEATTTAASPAAAAPSGTEAGPGAAGEGAVNGTLPTLAPAAPTTAQATVVKDRSCKTGSSWEEDCNTCWCLDNGRAACTTNSCEALPALPLAPGAVPAAVAVVPSPAAAPVAPVAPTPAAAAEGRTEPRAAPIGEAAAPAPAASSSSKRKRRFVLLATSRGLFGVRDHGVTTV